MERAIILVLLGTTACTELLPSSTTTTGSGTSVSDTSGMIIGTGTESSTGPGDLDETGLTTVLSTDSSADTTGNPAGWAWRREITILGHSAGSVGDVPVRVHLDAGSFDFDQVRSAPDDIRFLTEGGGLALPHEVERWEPPEAEVWVLVPQVDATDVTIWMEYGHDDPPPTPDRTEIWTGAMGVWHLAENLEDSSIQAHHGMVMGSVTGPGLVGNGRYYDGAVWDDLPSDISNVDAGAVQLWFHADGLQQGDISALFHGSADPNANLYGGEPELYVAIQHLQNGAVDVRLEAYNGLEQTAPENLDAEVDGAWLDSQWHHVVATWDLTQEYAWLLLDGEVLGEDQNIQLSTFVFSEWIRLGGVRVGAEARGFQGWLDEVRLYDSPLSLERAQVESWTQRIDTAVVGPEQPVI